MKSLFRFALVLAGGAALPVFLSAQPLAGGADSSGHTGPIIQFDTENYDFGKVLEGKSATYTFVVTNSGDESLDIDSVKPSCSCTVVSFTPSIPPHQTGTIPVSVHTSSAGPVDKSITVVSNDKTRPSVVLHVHGLVWVPVEIIPPTAYFNNVAYDAVSVAPVTLKIFNRTEEPLNLSAPASTSPLFSATLKTNVPGQEYEVIISVKPPAKNVSLTPVPLQATISMKSSSTNSPTVAISAMANIQPEIRYLPVQVSMPGGTLERGLTNYITVSANTPAPFKVLDASINAPGVNVTIMALTTNKTYNVAVGFPQGFEVKPNQKLVVTIKTDNPRHPTLEVPIVPKAPLRRPLAIPAPVALPAVN